MAFPEELVPSSWFPQLCFLRLFWKSTCGNKWLVTGSLSYLSHSLQCQITKYLGEQVACYRPAVLPATRPTVSNHKVLVGTSDLLQAGCPTCHPAYSVKSQSTCGNKWLVTGSLSYLPPSLQCQITKYLWEQVACYRLAVLPATQPTVSNHTSRSLSE